MEGKIREWLKKLIKSKIILNKIEEKEEWK